MMTASRQRWIGMSTGEALWWERTHIPVGARDPVWYPVGARVPL
jgi:hypothetical protein